MKHVSMQVVIRVPEDVDEPELLQSVAETLRHHAWVMVQRDGTTIVRGGEIEGLLLRRDVEFG